MGTSNLESCVIQFKSKLGNVGASGEQKEKAIDNHRKFLDSVWTKDAMFMNYLEGVQFSALCAGLVASGSEMIEEEMHRILEQQVAVMTVRGAVQDKYEVSVDISRL